ncbi:MAG: T9SS type A sorting domain-containing protein, partial [Chitinophagales bacterium]
YDTEGNFVWSYVTAPKVVGYNLDLLVDYNNDIYLAGDYNYSAGIPYEADFDVDPDSIYMLQGLGEKDAYIAKYNANAEIIWAYSVGGSGWEFATAIDLDNDLNICVGGWFYNTTDFDANPDSNFIWLPYIEPTYGNNVWMGKYDQDVLVPVAINNDEILNNTLLIAPNPAVDFINLYFSNQDAAGETIIIKDITGKIAGQYTMNNKLEINNLSPGIYFIQAGNLVTQFVKL